MSYIVEYTSFSGKTIPVLHKLFESKDQAEVYAAVAIKNGNYRSYNIVESVDEGYKILPNIDRDRYGPRDGLEGPFRTLSGKVVYYDPKEGSYYDPDTDMYLSYDEYRALDQDYSGMKDERDIPVKEVEQGHDADNRDELTKKLFPKMSPDEMKKRDQERNRKMNQQRFMKPGKPSRSREWGAYESATNINEAMRLDKVNIIIPGPGAEKFAKHYKAAMMGDYRDGGPTEQDQRNSNKFYDIYSSKEIRSGFAGSGTTEYTNNKTGETFTVDREPNGKTFYGTDHMINVVSGVNENITGMKKNIIAKIKSGATPADIKKQFPQLQKDDIDGFFKNYSTTKEAALDEGKIIATGLLRDKPFRKTFKSVEAMKKWADLEDADVRGYHAAPGKGEDTKESVNEDIAQDVNIMERDHEVQMAKSDLYKTANYAIKLHNMLKNVSEEQGIDGWMQAKITKAADYISSVYHSMEYDMVEKSQSEPIPTMESADKDKIQKQIDQTEKHMKSFSGNTSSVKMKKVAMQKKIAELKAKLKELSETTTAGGIATVAKPMGKTIKRKK